MDKRIRFVFVTFCAVMLTLSAGTRVFSEQKALIKEGDSFPQIVLTALDDPKDAAYLGIPVGKSFTVQDIPADLVLVEIMNVYCASCWKQVPAYNNLYDLIESKPETKGRIKIVGFGVGNEGWEVKYFRRNFEVPFPVFPDRDFVMHEAIGGSKTPFSIFVRQDPVEKEGLVASTHLGAIHKHEELFQEMKSMMRLDLAAIRENGKKAKAKIVYVKPVLSEEELHATIKTALGKEGNSLARFEEVTLEGNRAVFTGIVQKDGSIHRLFAEVIGRPPPCDVCHDIHFIYVFDATGKILQFIPLQLPKYGNKDFDEADVAKIRKRFVGRHIYKQFKFDANVDAVTRATITSAVIFRSLNDGMSLFNELKKKGYI
jgi:hypothetical protein